MNTKEIPENATKFTFRFNNRYSTEKETAYFWHWCNMNEIDVKHIGKSSKARCKWLQITVGKFLACFILSNWKELQLYKAV